MDDITSEATWPAKPLEELWKSAGRKQKGTREFAMMLYDARFLLSIDL